MSRGIALAVAIVLTGFGFTSAAAQEGPEDPPWSAADDVYGADAMADARGRFQEENGETSFGLLMFDRLEWVDAGDDGLGAWDFQAYYGGDVNKVWVKSEGEYDFAEDAFEEPEVQLLYSRAISPYFDLQAGVRQRFEPSDETYAVLGMQGLAPYWFEVDGAFFLSLEGDVTARVEAEYELRLTQRLILQPRFEIEAAAQDIDEQGLRAGFTEGSVGARLRYEIKRELAPYIGIEWASALGDTSDIVEAAGGEADDTRLVLGIRSWY